MAIETESTSDEMRRAHQCMQAVLHALRQARTLGGTNAKMHVGDMIRVIEQFKIGGPAGSSDVQ